MIEINQMVNNDYHKNYGYSMNENANDTILQKYSINTLLQAENETDSAPKQDLFGLNSPRGLLGKSYSNSAYKENGFSNNGGQTYSNADAETTYTNLNSGYSYYDSSGGCSIREFKPNNNYTQQKYNENVNAMNYASAAASGLLKRNSINSSSGVSSASSSIYRKNARRSASFSDCSGSNSPSVFDSPALFGQYDFTPQSNSSSESSSYNSVVSSPDGSLSEILNSLTLNDSYNNKNSWNINDVRSDYESSNLQTNYQTLQALKYLQQQPSALFNSLLNSTCPPANQYFDKWNNCFGGCVPNNAPHAAARFNRAGTPVYKATCTWSGLLPHKNYSNISYSSKVFLGGLPWDITEQLLILTFKQFGHVRVEWPGKEKQASQPKGYVYIVFESEKNVRALLQCCAVDNTKNGHFYYRIPSKRVRDKEFLAKVEVIPWIINDANYTKAPSQKLDPTSTVFVGALHGMLTAEGLAQVMNDLFGGVVYAGIDTDKHKYPIGSGRVTFNNSHSYLSAIQEAFIHIKTEKFHKKVQVDPYLEDSICSICSVQQGPYFCKDNSCFRYFCRSCWQWQHVGELRFHKQLMRNPKSPHIMD